MNKKELSEAIEEGMNNHSDWLGWQVTKAFLIFLGGIIVLSLIFNSYTFGHSQEQGIAIQEERYCNYPYLACGVSDNSKLIETPCPIEMNCSGYGGYYAGVDYKEYLCGYAEANAWFEQVKDNYFGNKSNLKMLCN